jgi:FAD/FMN-containing dehydrogenase
MVATKRTRLCNWGRYPVEEATVSRPESWRELDDSLAASELGPAIARGLGRSYGDASLNDRAHVIDATRLDRMLSFDEAGGVLRAEGGVTLKRIIEAMLPRGWFLPVSPGTRYVTLGGAIAADVHGKNHHAEGSIARYIDDIDLVLPTGEALVCSRDEQTELFFATLGGMGLTGFIRSASIRLRRVETSSITVTYSRARNLSECFDLFGDDTAGANAQPYAVAWIDCLARGASLGRSVIMAGRHTRHDELPSDERRSALRLPPEPTKRVPVEFPSAALNRYSVRAFNAAYYHRHDDGVRIEPFHQFFYPLDAVAHWNRIYGKRGFQQYQVVIPFEAAERGMRELLGALARSGRASFLAVLKTMGAASGGPLSFPMPGWTLALDLPNRPGLGGLLRELDAITLSFNGRRYLAKDASLDPDHVPRMYNRLDEFRALRRRIDPERRLSSSLSRRLGLDGPQ